MASELPQDRHPPTGTEDQALLAELLSGDGQRIFTAASAFIRSHPDASRHSQLCRRLLQVLRHPDQPQATRVSAGDALGALGDPRFDRDSWYLPDEEAAGFLEVPAGSFTMGSSPRRDPLADEDEAPLHSVSLPTYYIGRFPLTVRQFREFAATVHGERNFSAPRFQTFQPVVMVSWIDARAYCAWLEGHLLEVAPVRLRAAGASAARTFWRDLLEGRLRIQLPSEAEWEKAARGSESRIFPWGNVEEPGRANTIEAQILRPTPVGAMPGSVSPYGCEDMSGNVWEMTRSAFRPYPWAPTDEQQLRDDARLRLVIRGGSFLSPLRLSRGATRDHVPRGRESQDGGFRLVAAPTAGALGASPEI